MNLCFSTLGCTEWSLERILSTAEQFHIHALEIRGMDGLMDNRQIPALSPDHEADTQAMLARYHVIPQVLGTSCAFHAPEKWESAVEEGKACIDIAARLKIPYIRVFGNRLIGESLREQEECYNLVAKGIAELCDYASDTDVTVLLEVHGDYNRIETLGEVTARLKDYRNFGLIWDIAHTSAYGDRWEEFYHFFRPLIRHIHIKDKTTSPMALTIPGEGELPIVAIVHRLLEDGFDGYFSLEWEKKWHPDLPELPDALEAFVRILS